MPFEPLESQRALFEIPADVCYLNCAYMSPQLAAARERGGQALALKSQPWRMGPEHWFGRVEEARASFAALLGASADDIALVPSASYGLGTAAANCPVAAGQEVVVLDEQFPSNVYPWRRTAAEAGGSIHTVARPRSNDWTAAVLEAIGPGCAVVALPQVHWTDGSRLDLIAIGERVRAVGAKLVLDVSQSLGADSLDLAAIDPDWLVAPTYKWLLGPYSMGFLYAAPRNQSGRPLEEGWLARGGSEDFSALVDYRDDYRDGARRYDVGERSNFVLLPLVLAGLEQLLAWEVGRVAATLRRTSALLAEIGARHGLEALPEPRRAPNILGLRRPGGLPADLVPRLAEASVHVGRRGSTLRVSPHVHVTDEDLERFDDALGRALR